MEADGLDASRERRDRSGAESLRVLGIDPGTQVTGFGVVERCGAKILHVAHGTIRLPRDATLASRLDRLHAALREVIQRYQPDVASVEQVFVAASPRAALLLGHARGAALAALGASGLGVHEYAPARIKSAVAGNGRAGKDQIQRVVVRVLGLQVHPAEDAADALAAALCHAEAGRLERLQPRSAARRGRPRGPVVRVRSVS